MQETYGGKASFFEVLAQSFLVHVTTKLRQCVLYDMEVLVFGVGVSLGVETTVSRSHVGSRVRDVQSLYLWG